ncbi:hypothetical protein DCM91_11825 [Chitinophaga costaii]|nr:hypothetical protein DCM91_11825 [Chitinophaga costaii]
MRFGNLVAFFGVRREAHSAAAGAFFFAGAKKKQMSVSEFIRPRKKIKMTRIKKHLAAAGNG